jgi:hypothetical protein
VTNPTTAEKLDLLTHDWVDHLFRYDPESGHLFWKKRPHGDFKNKTTWRRWNHRWADRRAGRDKLVNRYIYRVIVIPLPEGQGYVAMVAARVIVFLHQKRWPSQSVTYRDKNRLNTKLGNLVEASKSEVGHNRRTSPSISGFPGVSYMVSMKQWRVCIRVDGKYIYGGCFKTLAEAVTRRRELKAQHHRFEDDEPSELMTSNPAP